MLHDNYIYNVKLKGFLMIYISTLSRYKKNDKIVMYYYTYIVAKRTFWISITKYKKVKAIERRGTKSMRTGYIQINETSEHAVKIFKIKLF